MNRKTLKYIANRIRDKRLSGHWHYPIVTMRIFIGMYCIVIKFFFIEFMTIVFVVVMWIYRRARWKLAIILGICQAFENIANNKWKEWLEFIECHSCWAIIDYAVSQHDKPKRTILAIRTWQELLANIRSWVDREKKQHLSHRYIETMCASFNLFHLIEAKE